MASPEPEQYTIGELADAADVTPRTIRFYVTEGLLPPPGGAGPHRVYGREHLLRLRLIRRLKAQYLPLGEIRARLGGLSVAELEALLSDGRDVPAPPRRALDYIASVLGRRPERPAPAGPPAAPAAELFPHPAMPAPAPPEGPAGTGGRSGPLGRTARLVAASGPPVPSGGPTCAPSARSQELPWLDIRPAKTWTAAAESAVPRPAGLAGKETAPMPPPGTALAEVRLPVTAGGPMVSTERVGAAGLAAPVPPPGHTTEAAPSLDALAFEGACPATIPTVGSAPRAGPLSSAAPGARASEPPRPTYPTGGLWRRVLVAPGVELQYQPTGDRRREARIARLIEAAVRLFAGDE